jgi:hypothetical protein
MGASENVVQRACIELLERLGWLVYRSNAGVAMRGGRHIQLGPAGWPDLTTFGPGGRCLLVECKAPGEELRPSQVERIGELMAMGHQVVVADSLDALQVELARLGVLV